MIGVVAATASGRTAARALAEAWPGEVRVVERGTVSDALREAFQHCDQVVSFLAVGATVRVLAPLLEHKTTDPAVVCVDESRRYAIVLLGGHYGGNALARRVGGVLGCEPVITTASDTVNQTPLDGFGADLGFRIENPEALAAFGAAVLGGGSVQIVGGDDWPIPPLPENVSPHGHGALIVISDYTAVTCVPAIHYRPPSLVIGVGAARGAAAEEVGALIDEAMASKSLHPMSVRCVATVDRKADEAGIRQAAQQRGVPVVTFPAAELAEVEVPNPSEIVRAEVGTPSVAEAAALRAARSYGRSAELIVAKHKSANVTVAVARLRPRGRLAIVGLGPGARDLLAPRAIEALRRSSVVVGLDQYVEQVRDLLRPGTTVIATGLGREEERVRTAVEEAAKGRAVALIGSGDAGVYALASPALELAGRVGAAQDQGAGDRPPDAGPRQGAAENACDIDVVAVPGITAGLAAASLLGAPLGHDHAYISLSDLNTPWEAIERRIRAAAEGDFTVCLYNPRSRRREWQLPKAMTILAAHRPSDTPVGVVRNATRPDESAALTTIEEFDPAQVDMFAVVIVGSSQSRRIAGRFVTPRGYQWSGGEPTSEQGGRSRSPTAAGRSSVQRATRSVGAPPVRRGPRP